MIICLPGYTRYFSKDLTSTSRPRHELAMIEQVTRVNTAKESETFDRAFPLRDTLRTYGVSIQWYFRRLEKKESVGGSFENIC
jgi:hypothetical protein